MTRSASRSNYAVVGRQREPIVHLVFTAWVCLARSSFLFFFFSSRRRHTRSDRDWSSDVCSSDLVRVDGEWIAALHNRGSINGPSTQNPAQKSLTIAPAWE